MKLSQEKKVQIDPEITLTEIRFSNFLFLLLFLFFDSWILIKIKKIKKRKWENVYFPQILNFQKNGFLEPLIWCALNWPLFSDSGSLAFNSATNS